MEQPIRAVFTGRNTVNRLQRNSKSDFSTPDALDKIPIRVVPSNEIQATPQQPRVLNNENFQEDLDIVVLKRQEEQDLEDTDDLRVAADQASEYLSINRADISSLREDLREQYEEQRDAANTESLESVLLMNAREEQIQEREALDVIHEMQRDQCLSAQAAAARLRGKQQHQARRMGKLRWQHASMYTQLQQLQQNQDLIAKREDVAQEELCEDRADIIVMKAQLDVHLDHIIEHDLQMKRFNAEQEAEEVRTSSGIGRLNAAFALVSAAVDDIEDVQERQSDDLRDAEIALDRVTQVTELTHACVDNLLDVSAGIWNGHDMITTLARQQDVVETQQRVGTIADLRGEHQRETNVLRQLIKQQASTVDRLDDLRKHVWSLTDQVQNAFDILEEQEGILNAESERAQRRELSIAKSSGFALKMLRESVLELKTILRQNGRELVDLQQMAVDFQQEARKMEAAARKDTEVIEQEIRRADDTIMELGNKIEWFKMISKTHRRQARQEGRELMETEQEETNEHEGRFADELGGPVARQILAIAEVAPDGTEISYRYLEGDESDGMFVAF